MDPLLALRELLWEAAVNVRIKYGRHEYLARFHRSAYLPLYYTEIALFFSVLSLSPQLESSPIWLQDGDTPLKWNLPIGVLYDLHWLHRRNGIEPWTLTLCVSGEGQYPRDTIIPFPSPVMGEVVNYRDTVFQVIINLLKQSCYVLRGNSRAILSMSEHDTKALWKAIQTHDYDMYLTTMRENFDIETVRRLPVKVFSVPLRSYTQLSLSPKTENDEPTILGDTLQEFNSDKLYIQGIAIDDMLSMEVLQVWRQFRHLDNFLYIVAF
ncbi:hypothetical protein PUMCH_000468 [Australozyma saopauloensis]|uniref:Autophagy protein 5 n=1 Tax=Australozyma saopauloensis TaxID=291208 RepID=A0AAX4H3Y2_9ASCO|nr:hypothetical protein PUMCH_000468 [[Candida] saopauloensis]